MNRRSDFNVFSDYDRGRLCADACIETDGQCKNDCDFANGYCEFECGEELIECINACPCYQNCPSGCSECESDFCPCTDPESNVDYVECSTLAYNQFVTCIGACGPESPACYDKCNNEYVRQLNQCPCRDGCPLGCPCEEYQCTSTTTTTMSITTTTATTDAMDSILVLNTFTPSNRPLITDQTGSIADWNMFFLYGDQTEVYHSCSLVWNNEMFVFGGEHEKRQISKVDSCQLTRLGSLSFDHQNGGCAATLHAVFLCFGTTNDYHQCHMSHDGPLGEFKSLKTIFPHRSTRIAASTLDVLAVGSFDPFNNKTEMLNTLKMEWHEIASYPYHIAISHTPIVFYDNFFFVFGGSSTGFDDVLGLTEINLIMFYII